MALARRKGLLRWEAASGAAGASRGAGSALCASSSSGAWSAISGDASEQEADAAGVA
jgi:hypothetical protein